MKNVPNEWNALKIKEYFSKAGEVERVTIINNTMGQSTGKGRLRRDRSCIGVYT